jgi:hypothetical protein
VLAFELQAALRQFMAQALLVSAAQQSRAEFTMHGDRRADDGPGQLVVSIHVHSGFLDNS